MIKSALIIRSRIINPFSGDLFVEVGGTPLAIRMIKLFKAHGVSDITVLGCRGERAKGVKDVKVNFEIPSENQSVISKFIELIENLNEDLFLTESSSYLEDKFFENLAKYTGNFDKTTVLTSKSGNSEVYLLKINELKSILNQFKKADTNKLPFDEITKIIKTGLNPEIIETGFYLKRTNSPADLLEAEIFHRKQMRESVLKNPPSSHNTDFSKYGFTVKQNKVTDIIVGRGFVENPGIYGFIPPQSASSPIFVFSDETVGKLYGKAFSEKLEQAGYNVTYIQMKDGEESKTLENYVKLTKYVLDNGVDERSVFVSVGGGVVCNVCGFIASTIYRGLNLVHFPTSLMAQCDAAISHKQAINGFKGKNMVGSYYSPESVIVDIDTLFTLNDRQIRDGMAEVIKHALGQDKDYVDFLMNYEGDFTEDADFLQEVVRRNVDLKCKLSVSDPKELAEGMVLQYGHTVGHPIEYLSGYELYHGESVAIGMVTAAHVSVVMGMAPPELVDIHIKLLGKYGLPVTIPPNISTPDIMETLKLNKRYLTEGTRMGLLTGVGELMNINGDYVIPVSENVLIEAIERTRK